MSSPRRLARVALPALATLMFALPPGMAARQTTSDTVPAGWSAPASTPPLPAPLVASKAPVAWSILGGTLGSGVGLIGGATIGYAMRSCSAGSWFCGTGEATIGALVGSVVGSTVGANIAAHLGGATPRFGSTFPGGLLGILSGVAGSILSYKVAPDGEASLLGFTLGQGIVTGLFAAHRR